jgi:hypothetical protein
MEAIADAPASDQHVPFINPSNARELAQKRWQMQREREERESMAPAPAIVDAEDAIPKDDARAQAIKRLESQMESIDAQIDKARDPDDWHKLTTARSKLFEQWRILSGIPMPGSRKPAADKPQRQRSPFVDPT